MAKFASKPFTVIFLQQKNNAAIAVGGSAPSSKPIAPIDASLKPRLSSATPAGLGALAITGRVVGVADGDTITVLDADKVQGSRGVSSHITTLSLGEMSP